MTPHLNEGEIQSYQARSMAAADLLRASNHLAVCEMCRARVAEPDKLHARVRGVQRVLGAEDMHLSYEEIAGYVDGKLSRDEAARVEMHTSECSRCASDLSEIGALRDELAPTRSSPALWDRVTELWRGWLGWRAAFAVAAAVCALVLFFVTRPAVWQFANLRPRTNLPRVQHGVEQAPRLPSSPQVRDGDRVVALANGRLTGLDALPDPYKQTVERALASGRVDPGRSLAGLRATGGVLLGASSQRPAVTLLEPLGTVVENQMPMFRWEPVTGADYQVGVYDGSYNLVASSAWIKAPEWHTSTALRRGQGYSWQLRMRRDGNEVLVPSAPAPEARFQVLATADEAEIVHLKRDWGESHLVLGVLFAKAGMLDGAEQELEKLRDQNPGSQEVTKLLASVKALRGASAKR